MDVDMSLDDLAAKDKKTSQQTRPRGGGGGGRGAGGRGGATRSASSSKPASPYVRPPPDAINNSWKHDLYSSDRREGGRPAGGAPTVASGPTSRILIENLHYEIGTDDLKRIFSQAGTIVEGPTIKYDRSGRSTGVAHVTFSSVGEAKLARDKCDGQKAKGQEIRISFSPIHLPRTSGLGGNKGPGSGAGFPLLGRLGGVVGETERDRKPRDPRPSSTSTPSSSSPREPRPDRPTRGGGRGGRGGGRGGASGPSKEKRGPVDQEGLDAELEAFMKTPTAAAAAPAAAGATMEE